MYDRRMPAAPVKIWENILRVLAGDILDGEELTHAGALSAVEPDPGVTCLHLARFNENGIQDVRRGQHCDRDVSRLAVGEFHGDRRRLEPEGSDYDHVGPTRQPVHS